jgi:hypothetical protein
MPVNSKYLFVVSMDVVADKEALFNEIYDTEHIPSWQVLAEPAGVITRFQIHSSRTDS